MPTSSDSGRYTGLRTSGGSVGRPSPGFSAIELLVGLALALCLAAAAAPLWLSLQSGTAREGDRTIQWLQGRVAIARFERDLRLASGKGCLFTLSAPILEAAADQVVFLGRTATDSAPVIIEWEMAGGSLMRRWGDCPETRPRSYTHSLFRDHKTMLEGVRRDGTFVYVIDGRAVSGPVPEDDLASIEAVFLDMQADVQRERGSVRIATTARVGR